MPLPNLPALLAIFTLLLCAIGPAHGQTIQPGLRFERITVEHGLAQQSVASIVQDRQGFIWFGTQAGLHRYDGYSMTVFHNDPNDPGSLPDNFVASSHIDQRGDLWFGTKGGLARFDHASGRFQRHALTGEGSVKRRGVLAIVPAPDGELWLGTSDGLVRFDPASGRHQDWRNDPADPSSLRDNRISALAIDGHGALWIGTASGLDRLAPGAAGFEHFAVDPVPNTRRDTVLALSMGPRDTLWIGTADGLAAWHLEAPAPRPLALGGAERLDDLRVGQLYHDPGGRLWAGTDTDGLKWHDPAGARFLSYRHSQSDEHSLSDNQIMSVLVDRTGTLWVGTYFGGANRSDLASGGFTRYGPADGLGRAKVRALVDEGGGRLWVGTTGDGLMRLDLATRRVERMHAPGLETSVVTALALARERLWIGTPTGLLWRDAHGRYGRVALGGGAPASYVQALRIGRDGTLWIVTRGGLAALAPGASAVRSWRHDPGDPASLGDNYGMTVLEDRRGIIWIGTESGLERFDRASDTFTHYRHDPADSSTLRHSRIYSLLESAGGDLWIGTAGGLHRMAPAAASGSVNDAANDAANDAGVRFRFYPFGDEQPAPPIGAVLEDGKGMLWASTTAGITRLDPATGRSKNYTGKDGLIDGAYFVGSGWRSPDGRLHFGGMHGISSFQPDEVRANPYPPVVVITEFQLPNQPRALQQLQNGRAVTLSHDDAMFTLEFAALHFGDPRANRYAYQLEGFDKDWVETSAARRFATYTNLDPGHYRFRVRGASKDGVWSLEPATLEITIKPPFWKTWWFRTLVAASVLALSYLAYRLRVHALVEHKERLESEVGQRTAELRLQKEDAERQKESVERAHRDIALLSDMGRVLTANLDSEAIMATLYRHVRQLMDAHGFALALLRPARGVLEVPFAMLDGRRGAPFELALDPSCHVLACCALEGRALMLDDVQAELAGLPPAAHGPAAVALAAASTAGWPGALLCVPVTAGERVLGAITVQSDAAGAYGRVHLDMLGTLAAYLGIAIDNAEAYHQLKATQAQLAAHEKLASLGALVAGVAHELNTPIGNSLLMASTLQERTDAVAERFDSATLKRSDLLDYVAASREASGLIVRSLHNAAELVSSFRQVSVDQTSDQRRRFDLAQACHEIAATMMNAVRRAGHHLDLEVPGGIAMDGYPGPLGQVIINFINNAMLHAFDAPGGTMTLEAALSAGADGGSPGTHVRLRFSDNGAGIDAAHLSRIFDPFFTTRMGQGGTGLGLSVAYNIATTLLGGTIRVDSVTGTGAGAMTGTGTTFVLELPLVAPQPLQAQAA